LQKAQGWGTRKFKGRATRLILTHWTLLGNTKEDDMVREIRQKYSGPIVIARDLDVIVP
jgi:hypothetical protein